MFSQSHKKNGKISLIIDIGSHSIAGAFILFSRNRPPKIIFSKRLSLPIPNEWNRAQSLIEIERSAENLMKDLMKEGAEKIGSDYKKEIWNIKEVFCIVSSPWCNAEIKTIKSNNKTPVEITPSLIESMVKKDSESASGDNSFALIEKKIIRTSLNGYVTDKPLYKKAKEIEIVIFEGSLARDLGDKMVDTLNRFVSAKIIFHSFTLVAFAVIDEMFPDIKDYIFIDITGEATDITLVKNKFISKTSSFPKGKNLFIGNVSRAFDVNQDVGLSFIKLYYEQKSEKSFYNKIKDVMGKSEYEWFSAFKETMRIIEEGSPLKIFLSTDPNLAEFFTDYIKTGTEKLFKAQGSEIITLNNKAFNQFCDYGDNKEDPFLSLETIFLDKIFL